MRRWAASIILLISGVVVSVLVAEACAYFSPLEMDFEYSFAAIEHGWTVPHPPWFPALPEPDPPTTLDRDAWRIDPAYGFGIRYVEFIPPFPEFPPEWGTVNLHRGSVAHETSAGWPLYCLRGQQLHAGYHPDPAVRGWWAKNGVLLDRLSRVSNRGREREQLLLPLQPIGWGLLLDSLLYAGLLWLVVRGPRKLRRLVRRARGRCVRCGYRLTGLTADRCPECGRGTTR